MLISLLLACSISFSRSVQIKTSRLVKVAPFRLPSKLLICNKIWKLQYIYFSRVLLHLIFFFLLSLFFVIYTLRRLLSVLSDMYTFSVCRVLLTQSFNVFLNSLHHALNMIPLLYLFSTYLLGAAVA